MTVDHERLLDGVGWGILAALQENGRLSFAELGRRVALSLQAVVERVRRLDEAGIITGYHAPMAGVARRAQARPTGRNGRTV